MNEENEENGVSNLTRGIGGLFARARLFSRIDRASLMIYNNDNCKTVKQITRATPLVDWIHTNVHYTNLVHHSVMAELFRALDSSTGV